MTFSYLCSFFLSISLVRAIPQLSFPINAQVPPLAIVSQPFEFTFSPSTFSYDTPTISYSISNNTPSWLNFDASTRTFSGTPANTDVGNFTFTLSANDTTGSASGDVLFLVVQDDGVTAGEDIETLLDAFGGVDGNGGIVLSNEKPFSWTFPVDTFNASGIPIETYYAVSTGHTPLPSWIKFYANNITFAGTALEIFSQIAPPQYFTVTLIASTYSGFASASQTFNVVVGAHDLIIENPADYVNGTIGGNVSYTFSLDGILLDGQQLSSTNISSITASIEDNDSWLTFDNSSLTLSGSPTQGDEGTIVTVVIEDVFSDVVHATLHVDIYDGLFATNIPTTLNATVGKEFSFVLNDTLFATSDVQLSVDFKASGGKNWLSYDSSSRTISGTPTSGDANDVEVDINASSPSLSQKQSTSFTVKTVDSGATPTPTSTSSTSSNKTLIIALSVVLPVVAILILIALLVWYRHRRRKPKLPSLRDNSPIPPISRPYNTTPDEDWPLEEEKAWGEPRQLGGMDLFKRGVSGMFTLKSSDVGTTGANVGGAYEYDASNEKTLPTPNLNGPQEPPKIVTRGSWRRSDGRDWGSTARSSDASLATVSTNEIFSVRLVQSPNPNGLNPISPAVGGVSPLLGGMGLRGGATPLVNVHPPPEEDQKFGDRSQDTIGTFSEGSSGVDYEGMQWETAERMFPQSGRGSGLGHWDNRTSHYSVDSFQSDDHQYDEQGRGTWYQKRESSRDTIAEAVQYPVSRVSGPLSPVSPNVDWSGGSQPGKPRLVEFTKEKQVDSSNSSQGSGEVAFV